MKFLHIADLHIGKTVNDFSMIEDQKFILNQILNMAAANQVEALVIAGDIYDRSIPTGEAVALFDAFLTALAERKTAIILISGNHDSPERISFGEKLLNKEGVFIAGVLKDKLGTVDFEGEGYKTEFVLLPFCKPSAVNAKTSEEAVRTLLGKYWEQEQLNMQTGGEMGETVKHRVLVTHFFVTDAGREPELSDSETTIHIGGLDNVDASVFDGFDYVALGHIHKPQQLGSRPIWYAGSPLKYSFGETGQNKSALLVTMEREGVKDIQKLELHPLHEMRKIKGELEQLLQNAPAEEKRQDYIQAILTDRGELIDPIGTLRSIYPNIMQIIRDTDGEQQYSDSSSLLASRLLTEKKSALELFEAFYETVRQEQLTAEEKKVIADIIRELEE